MNSAFSTDSVSKIINTALRGQYDCIAGGIFGYRFFVSGQLVRLQSGQIVRY